MDWGTLDDFNFQIGDWRVQHRRLKDRLVGSTDWEIFPGTSSMRRILGGAGNIEDNLLEFPGGAYRAIALRSFQPATREWAIWWLDSRAPDRLDVPVVGRFENGVGSFYADDLLAGRPIRVRFRWESARSAAPRWEQAFSPDAGATWEVNWEMNFSRA